MTTQVWAVLIGAYLLGSIPSAYLVARIVAGVSIWQVGSGNMGAKNTFKSVGPLAGLVVGAIDVCKGALAVAMARHLGLAENLVLWAGACAVLGHDFSIFVGFRGGQGMASIIGVFGVLFPCEMGLALVVLAVALAMTRRWNLSCFTGFSLFYSLLWLFGRPPKHLLYPVLLLPTIAVRKVMVVWQTRRATA